jgi:hypothetical protein
VRKLSTQRELREKCESRESYLSRSKGALPRHLPGRIQGELREEQEMRERTFGNQFRGFRPIRVVRVEGIPGPFIRVD